MPTRRQLIQKITLNANASSVTFSNIPGIYTDLMVLTSARTDFTGVNGVNDYILMRFNGDSGSNYTFRQFIGNGSAVSSQSGTLTGALAGRASGSDATSSTFGNSKTYISNYTATTNKSVLTTAINENNGTSSAIAAHAALWSNTSVITSILLRPGDGSNFISNSTFYLYGITHVPIIRGGTVTVPGDGFKYHTFRSSGSLQVIEPGDVEYLVVAGGGGGGGGSGGGGGAGGLRYGRVRTSQGISSITIGAGGGGAAAGSTKGTSGSNSSGLSISTTGGGGGGSHPEPFDIGVNGGSGGGGGSGANAGMKSGGSGVSGEGFAGGQGGTDAAIWRGGGGGGGSSAAGSNATSAGTNGTGGAGGAGTTVFGIAYAGGGGGGGDVGSGLGAARGGNGGTGSPLVDGSSAIANSGSGGGGRRGSGASGIVIIRYPYDGN